MFINIKKTNLISLFFASGLIILGILFRIPEILRLVIDLAEKYYFHRSLNADLWVFRFGSVTTNG